MLAISDKKFDCNAMSFNKINDFRRVSIQTRNMAGKDVTYSEAQILMQQCITLLFCHMRVCIICV